METDVFSEFFLNVLTETDFLIYKGRLFHSLEAATVKVLSPAWVRVRGYLSWRLSLEDLRFIFGVYTIRQ